MKSMDIGTSIAHEKYLFVSDSNLFQKMFKQINYLGRKE